jgi:CubicO group peptidase (beta-lactamase class C family)
LRAGGSGSCGERTRGLFMGPPADYMRFAQRLLNGGELDGERILNPETVVLLHRNHAPTTQAEGNV